MRVLAYCLMTNHVHFVLVPERTDSLAMLFRRVHGANAQSLNARRGSTLAEPLLLVSYVRESLVAGDSVCGCESSAGCDGGEGRGVPVVERCGASGQR